jgi:uncharacterized damage-inducible protein DinB
VHEFFAVSLSFMSELRGEPPSSLEDPREILLQQLSYYRATLLAKLDGLSEEQLTSSILPSGWSPLGLLKHLVFVERRWMQWGFEAEQVPDPWGDHNPDSEGWLVAPGDSVTDLTARLTAIAARTEVAAGQADLTQRARLGGRFSSDPPTLGWILAHLLQEYARHIGQMDVVRELIDGSVGE